MIENKVKYYNFIKSLSKAIDLISKTVIGHHLKVTYISSKLAEKMNLAKNDKKNLILSALIHDIGVFHLNQNFSNLSFDTKDNKHALVGYELLKKHKKTRSLAKIIKYHHTEWKAKPDDKYYLSHILFLADRTSVLINESEPILSQVERIKKIIDNSNNRFWPEAVNELNKISNKECFWLSLTSEKYINKFISRNKDLCDDKCTLDDLIELSEIFSHIIDFRSSFTATHSEGVTGSALALSDLMNLHSQDLKIIEIAGYLHDIGKLAVPRNILHKRGKLTSREYNIIKAHTYYTYQVLDHITEKDNIKRWAAYHHEKLNGNGYPFHLNKENLSQGARIMAVADIFSAVTEDRPYRKGMDKNKVINLFQTEVKNNNLDKNIVSLLIENYDEVYKRRQQKQIEAVKYFDEFKQNIEKIKR